jgi:hypothetical protein
MAKVLYTKIESGERLVATDITDLTFFPKGTILTFSSEAWGATTPEFKNIWKICNGQNGTPDLRNKFLCGAESSGNTGGGTANLVKENLPKHSHTITDNGHTHDIYVSNNSAGHGIAYESATPGAYGTYNTNSAKTGISIDESFPGQGEYSKPFDVIPAYYTVIYIMKVA